jgi:hypothetical protein
MVGTSSPWRYSFRLSGFERMHARVRYVESAGTVNSVDQNELLMRF